MSGNLMLKNLINFPTIKLSKLDACRNHPFRSWVRGNERGFVAIHHRVENNLL
jgi:hypothetical protein